MPVVPPQPSRHPNAASDERLYQRLQFRPQSLQKMQYLANAQSAQAESEEIVEKTASRVFKSSEKQREYAREYSRKYRAQNPEKVRESQRRADEKRRETKNAQNRLLYAANREERLRKQREYYESNREARKAYQRSEPRKAYGRKRAKHLRETSPEKVNASKLASHKKRLAVDVEYRIRCRLRSRVSDAVCLRGGYKAGSAVRDLGITCKELILYIESLWHSEMSWENYGEVWHIDHIYPLAKANLTDRVQFLAAANWRNLQPMLGSENLEKSDKITPEGQALFDRLCQEFGESRSGRAA